MKPDRPAASCWAAWRRARVVEHDRRDDCASADKWQDLRAGARRLARRLVLAAGVGPPGQERAQGVHAHHDGARRALAPARCQDQSRHSRHRHRQRDQVGEPQRHRADRPLLWRCRRLRRRRAGAGGERLFRVPRCVRAGERRERGEPDHAPPGHRGASAER